MDRCSKFDTKSISEKISFNIKNLLELYSMSILELSNKTKISYSTLHKIVNNSSNPTIDTLETIAKVFDLEILELLSKNPLLPKPKDFLTMSIPVIHFSDIYINDPNPITYIDKLVTPNTSQKAFATNNSQTKLFDLPDHALLFFDIINLPVTSYNQQIVISHFDQQLHQLKKIIIDANKLYLEDLKKKVPCRQILPEEKLEYFLFNLEVNYMF